MRTNMQRNDHLLTDAQKLENPLCQTLQNKPVVPVELPTWDLGKPVVDLDFSDTSAIQNFLDQST
jgi:hypothetical protein